MPNKKISELTVRVPVVADLMLVGDPTTGYSYKNTISTVLGLGVSSFNGRTGAVVAGVYTNGFTATGGETTFTNASIGSFVLMFRNGLVQENADPADGNTYYTKSGTTLTYSTALTAGERIYILSITL